MKILIIILSFASVGIAAPSNDNAAPSDANITDLNKDVYVIHAMVYQVGIITNKTDNTSADMTGDQEALTFYHTNGSNIDLSGLPTPLLTNVTAQGMVGVAPAPPVNSTYRAASLPWASLEHLASLASAKNTGVDKSISQSRATRAAETDPKKDNMPYAKAFLTRSAYPSEENKDTDDKTPMKIVKGAAVIPQKAGVQSLAIPPLLSLTNNFTEIPVPIPNTSVVHYAKVNTLIHAA